jgi:hypothetical protein
MLLNSHMGYAFLKQCTPLFLHLATKFPELWTNNSAISVFQALHSHRYEITMFVFRDTIAALAFGLPPLLHYDTNLGASDWSRFHSSTVLEWIYGCPTLIVTLIAKVNSARMLRLVGQTALNQYEQLEMEAQLRKWQPTVDKDDRSSQVITRLAILECWRQAVLIYMHMASASLV